MERVAAGFELFSHLSDANVGLDAEQHDVGRLVGEAVQVGQDLPRTHGEQLLLEHRCLGRRNVSQRHSRTVEKRREWCCGGRESAGELVFILRSIQVYVYQAGVWPCPAGGAKKSATLPLNAAQK